VHHGLGREPRCVVIHSRHREFTMDIAPIVRPAPDFATDAVVDVPPFGACRRVDIWDAWVYAQAEVELAFRSWAGAPAVQRRDLHVAYRAALDREERAAVVLAAVVHTPLELR